MTHGSSLDCGDHQKNTIHGRAMLEMLYLRMVRPLWRTLRGARIMMGGRTLG
jgi:hypothetical protein